MNDVTVCIPTIPPRRSTFLPRALASVFAQAYPISAVNVRVDLHREGAWKTRQHALNAVSTRWTAFLDDDDEFYPQHIDHLMDCALTCNADYVFSYWDLVRTPDVLHSYGRSFDPQDPHETTITVLVKTELAQQIGFTAPDPTQAAGREDWRFTVDCVAAGAKIVHLPEMTWFWRHHGLNTSGRDDRW